MRFDYSYPEFVDLILHNPQFSFVAQPKAIRRDTDHGCSCYAMAPGGAVTVYFHNFDLNSSYHVQFSITERMITAFDLYKQKDLVKHYFENKLKMQFNQEVYDAIQLGYSEYFKQIDNYIQYRGGQYKTIHQANIRICFDKETHEYLGYSMTVQTHLIYHKKHGNISPIIFFDIHGYKNEITYEIRYPFNPNRKFSKRVYVNKIPDEASVMQHWIARCGGDDDATFEKAMDGIDRIMMAITVKEMINI